MSFFKKLFGGGASAGSASSGPAAEVEHEGYLIRATPMKEGGQFRVCGVITKEIGGEMREHRLIRADMFASAEDAAQATVRKAKQVIKEQGDNIFGQRR